MCADGIWPSAKPAVHCVSQQRQWIRGIGRYQIHFTIIEIKSSVDLDLTSEQARRARSQTWPTAGIDVVTKCAGDRVCGLISQSEIDLQI